MLTVVADNAQKNPTGGFGLLVFLCVAVAVYFLLRSMVKHLHKVEKMKPDDDPRALRASRRPPRTPR